MHVRQDSTITPTCTHSIYATRQWPLPSFLFPKTAWVQSDSQQTHMNGLLSIHWASIFLFLQCVMKWDENKNSRSRTVGIQQLDSIWRWFHKTVIRGVGTILPSRHPKPHKLDHRRRRHCCVVWEIIASKHTNLREDRVSLSKGFPFCFCIFHSCFCSIISPFINCQTERTRTWRRSRPGCAPAFCDGSEELPENVCFSRAPTAMAPQRWKFSQSAHAIFGSSRNVLPMSRG